MEEKKNQVKFFYFLNLKIKLHRNTLTKESYI